MIHKILFPSDDRQHLSESITINAIKNSDFFAAWRIYYIVYHELHENTLNRGLSLNKTQGLRNNFMNFKFKLFRLKHTSSLIPFPQVHGK